MTRDGRVRLSAKQAADYICVSRSTLAKWRMNGVGPKWHRLGSRLVYYFQNEIDEWLDECDRIDQRRPQTTTDDLHAD